MKTFASRCLAVILISLAAVSYAQLDCPVINGNKPVKTEGQEFLLCFMANELPTYTDQLYEDIYLAALSQPAEVKVSCPFLGINKIISLNAYEAFSYRISNDIARDEKALIYSTEVVDSSCIYVSSSAPIICYGMNHKLFTADAFLAFPRHTAGTHYMAMSYYNSAFNTAGQDRPSEFVVAAWEDNTTITIVPTTTTSSGVEAGTPMTFTLNQFEGVQVQSERITLMRDLTGSTITSDKPIVVFSGHERAEVPVGYEQPGGNSTSRDHLAEQIPPTGSWGTKFVVSSFFRGVKNDQVDLMRVLAKDDNTQVSINNIPWGTPLGAGQYRDTLILGPMLVETSGPALVGMYAHTTLTQTGTGDPFLAVIPPVDQYYNEFTYFISTDSVYNDQHVLIITERSGVNRITSDGTALPAAAFRDIPGSLGGSQFSLADLVLPGGIHRISTLNVESGKGISIVAYGWGSVDSYGYTAGALLKPLQGITKGETPTPVIPRDAVPEPKIYLRNMLADRIYFDKAVIKVDDASKLYDVQLAKNIALDTRFIERGQNLGLDFVVTPLNEEPIHGTMTVYYHTARWRDLKPVNVSFTIEPQHVAGVHDMGQGIAEAKLAPNPVMGTMTVASVSLQKAGAVSIRLIDATGREVLSIAKPRVAAGHAEFQLHTEKLPAGIYLCEIVLPDEGTAVRKQLVVLH